MPKIDHARFETGAGRHLTLGEKWQPDAGNLREIFDALGEGVVLTDLDSRILFSNLRFAAMLGFTREELLGRRGYEMFLQPDQWPSILARNQNRKHGQSEKYQLNLRKKDGQTLWVEINAVPYFGPDGAVMGTLSLFADTTDRKQEEADLNLIVDCVTGRFEGCFFESVTRNLAVALGSDLAFITECLAENRDRVRTIAYWQDGRIEANREFDLKNTACEAVIGKSPVFIPSGICEWFPADTTLREQSIEGYVGIPLFDAAGKPLGHIALMNRAPFSDQPRLLAILKVIGTRVAAEMERNRTEAELRRKNERLQLEIEAHTKATTTVRYLREEISSSHNFKEIVGTSKAMLAVLDYVELVSKTEASILLLGETGTGKELFARAIHDRSGRSCKPLIKLNCAALPAELIESELFGHEKGSFTGAFTHRKGRFELADGGTLFLDEVGELTLPAQAKLLRVLQDREFERVGGAKPIHVDVRLIAATNRNLQHMMEAGDFRADLFYRLNVFPILIPNLRERTEDIEPLAYFFLRKAARRLGREFRAIDPRSMTLLKSYNWPGNVRELENLIERSAILSPGATLVVQGLQLGDPEPSEPAMDSDRLDVVSRRHLRDVLDRCEWLVEGERGAARRLGLKPSTLRSKMQRLGIRRHP